MTNTTIPNTDRGTILADANAAINGPRARDYGDARDNFGRTAQMWSAYKGIEFTATDVAALLALLKVSRLANTPNHQDSWVDLVGYAALGGEVAQLEARDE
jgi:hypothetical protein